MATGKSTVNLAFGCILLVLLVTAAASYYKKSGPTALKPNAVETTSGSQLPANHPDVNLPKRIAALEETISRDPKNPDLQTELANLYYDVGQYQNAADHYQQSLSLRPGDPNAETDLAVCYHYTGRDDKALETLDRVLSHSPGFSQALFNKGIILINTKKDVQEGIRAWEELLRLDPAFAQKAELQKKIDQVKGTSR